MPQLDWGKIIFIYIITSMLEVSDNYVDLNDFSKIYTAYILGKLNNNCYYICGAFE